MERALVEFPFLGLDSKTNAKLVQPGKLLELENGVFREALSIIKRNGYRRLPAVVLAAADRISSARAIARLGDELLLVGDTNLFSYSPSIMKWIDKGALSPVSISSKPLVRNTYQQSNPDVATLRGVTVSVWSDTRGGVYAKVVDETTGTPLLSDEMLNAVGVRPRAIALDTSIVVIYQAVSDVIARSIPIANPSAFTDEVTLVIDGNLTPVKQHLDLCRSYARNAAIFAYSTDGDETGVGYVLRDGSLGAPGNGFPDVVTIAEACHQSLGLVFEEETGDVYVLYSNGTDGISSAGLYKNLEEKYAPVVIDVETDVRNVTGAIDSAGDIRVVYEIGSTKTYDHIAETSTVDVSDGTPTAPADLTRSVGLAGKAFLHSDGYVYCGIVHDPTPQAGVDGLQNTYFLVREDGAIAAKMQPGTADKVQAGQIPSIVAVDALKYLWAQPVRTQFISEGSTVPGGVNTTYSLVGLATAGLDFAGSHRTVEMGGTLLITGGILGNYDGQSVVEHGFHLFPENLDATVTDGAGSMEAGDRQICAVFCWYDAKGNRHQSAPSIPVPFTCAGGASKVSVDVPTLRITEKRAPRSNVTVEFYSTEQAGTVFYRTPNENDDITQPIYNDPTADSVTFIRTCADTALIANEILYTAGGVVENIGPIAADLIAVSKERVLIVTAENRLRVWYSKRILSGDAMAFSDFFYFDVSPVGGDILAIEIMDDKTLLFRESRIEMVTGDGPDETGIHGAFSPAVLITTDVGCAAPDSVAIVSDGVVFKSAKGIYLLSRSLQAHYVGAPVERYNDLAIVSAVLLADVNEVRFLTSEGRALVWNTFFNEWSTFTNHAAVDGAVWAGTFVFATADGELRQETPGIYRDGTRNIRMLGKTAWFKLAGIQGLQRVRSATFLGEFFSKHKMLIRVGYDYNDFSHEQHPWDPGPVLESPSHFGDDSPFGDPEGGVFGGDGDPVYQFQVGIKRQKCQSVQFEFSDVGSSTGKAYSLQAIALEVGLKKGAFRLPAAKRI